MRRVRRKGAKCQRAASVGESINEHTVSLSMIEALMRQRIDDIIDIYSEDAHPFEWTKQAVFLKHPCSTYAD